MEAPKLSSLDAAAPDGAALRARASGAPELLDDASVRSLWEDSWTDAAGRHWQTIATATEIASADYGYCEGEIRCDGHYAGKWNRTVEMHMGHGQVTHGNLSVERAYQGKGFARQWMARCAERYMDWNVEQIDVTTGHDGLAVWPKMGFDVTRGSQREQMLDRLVEDMGQNLSALPARERMGCARDLHEMRQSDLASVPEMVRAYPDLFRRLGASVQIDLSCAPAVLLDHLRSRDIQQRPQTGRTPSL
jgi:GNAT superfamily N-acetyltransferase